MCQLQGNDRCFSRFSKPEPRTDLEGALHSPPVLPQCTKTCPVACPLVTPPMACSVWAPLIFPLSEVWETTGLISIFQLFIQEVILILRQI